MTARARLVAVSLLVLSLAAPSQARGAPPETPVAPLRAQPEVGRPEPGPERYRPGQVIVRYRSGVKEERRAEIRGQAGLRRVKRLALTGSELAEIRDGSSVEQTVARLRKHPHVLAAQPNFVYRAVDLPDDELFPHLWGLHNVAQYVGGSRTHAVGVEDVDVDAPEAWAITRGERDVVVGVIDTAVDVHHPDLAANAWTNPGEIAGDGVDNDHNGYVDDVHGWNFSADTPSTWEPGEHYHGTHVAGTIAAVAGNGVGVAGVAPNVKIAQLQFLGSDGYGYTSDAVEALAYARNMGIRLTSNSWGGGAFDLELRDAICGADGIFVAAAGNSASDSDTRPMYPAAYDCPNIVSVAALTNSGALAAFSNWGAASVDLGAPGQDVLSTMPGGEYGFLSGTSMATPHVSGIVALMLSLQPGLEGSRARELLVETATPLESLAGRTVSGGMANALAAVYALQLVTDPSDRAIEVPADQIVTATYLVDVQPGPAFPAISLRRGDVPVAAATTLSGKVLRIAPAEPLPIDGLYTVIIPEDAVRDLAGRAMRAHRFGFKTHDTIVPVLLGTDPVDGGTDVAGSKTVRVTFDEDVKAGPAFGGVRLLNGTTSIPIVAGTDRAVLTLDPVYSLARSTSYTVDVPAAALVDLSGNPVPALRFGFATAVDVTPPRSVSCFPPPYTAEVPTTIDVVFDYTKNVALGPAADGIYVDCFGSPAQLELRTSANVLTLHPVSPLASSTLCLAWVPPGALQDEFGNTNDAPNGVYFWTRDDRSPLLVSTAPADGATGVFAGSAITAQYDEDVVPGPAFSAITLTDDAGAAVPFSFGYLDDGYGFTYSYIAAFTPLDVLGSLRGYTLVVPDGAFVDPSPQGNPAAGLRVSFTTEQDLVRPSVVDTDPWMYAIEVPPTKVVAVSFSEKIVPASTFGGVVLRSGTAAVPATVTTSGTKLLVAPAAPLPTDATYVLTVPAGAVADLAGNTLAAGRTLSFSTPDTLPPRVVGTSPAAGAKDVAVDGTLAVTLSEDAFPGPAFGSITLRDHAGAAIPVTSAFYEDGEGPLQTWLIVTPSVPMRPDSVYTVTLPAGAVVDARGNASAPHAFSFSTPYPVVASDPAAGAVGVPLDAIVTLSLLAPGTAGPTVGGIVLAKGTAPVAAAATLTGTLLTVRPAAPLAANATYKLAVPAGAVVSGNGIPLSAFTLSFRTYDPDVPRVTWTDPANGATGVPAGATITVGLSEATSPGPAFGAIGMTDAGGAPVPIYTEYLCDPEGCFDDILVVTPMAPLPAGGTYSVSLPAGALVDAAGNGSQAHVLGFTTQ